MVFENYAPALEDWITIELDPRDEFTFRIDKGLDPIKPFVYNFVVQKPPYLTIPKYAHEENIKQTKENPWSKLTDQFNVNDSFVSANILKLSIIVIPPHPVVVAYKPFTIPI